MCGVGYVLCTWFPLAFLGRLYWHSCCDDGVGRLRAHHVSEEALAKLVCRAVDAQTHASALGNKHVSVSGH